MFKVSLNPVEVFNPESNRTHACLNQLQMNEKIKPHTYILRLLLSEHGTEVVSSQVPLWLQIEGEEIHIDSVNGAGAETIHVSHSSLSMIALSTATALSGTFNSCLLAYRSDCIMSYILYSILCHVLVHSSCVNGGLRSRNFFE